MKKLFYILAMSLAVYACSTMSKAEREARDAKVAAFVEKALELREYTIDVDRAYPNGGRTMNLSAGYYFKVKNNTVESYMPYFGRAFGVPYGGGKGLDFTAPIKSYNATAEKNGGNKITIEVDNDEDSYSFELEIFSNGRTSIYVSPVKREPINFSGWVKVE